MSTAPPASVPASGDGAPREASDQADGAPYDVVIVGAGPAGLAASAHLAPLARTLLVDAGQALEARDHRDQARLTAGVGGAGLFSDGKFSFFPAASGLWSLDDEAALRSAHEQVRALLVRHGLPAPALPASLAAPVAPAPGRWSRKDYESRYLPLAARAALTAELFAPSASGDRHRLGTRAALLPDDEGSPRDGRSEADARREGRSGGGRLRVRLDGPGGARVVRARHVVLAGGRLSPLQAGAWPQGAWPQAATSPAEAWSRDRTPAPTEARPQAGEPAPIEAWPRGGAWPLVFRRLEFGVRIVDRAEAPFFARLPGVDPKLRWVQPGGDLEWRTFCMCRRGEVVATDTGGLVTASGRADGAPTDESSVGLLVRTRDPERAARLAAPLLEAARRERSLWSVSLADALSGRSGVGASGRASDVLAARLGEEGAACVVEGLALLARDRPELVTPTATLVGPSIEGVGLYPRVDRGLRAGRPGLWAAGDGAGVFRGLVAALVSGVYVARQIEAELAAER